MGFKLFLDANILLDFTLRRSDYETSRVLIEMSVGGRIQAFITPSIVHIVGYWLNKAYGNLKAKELLLAFLADVQVIDIQHEITLHALHSKMNDIEDALQYYTAMHHKLDYFITRDKSLKKAAIPGLPVCSPEEFIMDIA
jgi:predicted nucleic acid-binding protein